MYCRTRRRGRNPSDSERVPGEDVAKAINAVKESNRITSPKRCFRAPAD